jgi:putative DNA primase/helicase
MASKDAKAKGSSTQGAPVIPIESASSFWTRHLVRKRNGDLVPTIANAIAILRYDPEWRAVFGFNLMTGKVKTFRAPPFEAVEYVHSVFSAGGDWQDVHTARTQSWLARVHDLYLGPDVIRAAVDVVAKGAVFHPVRDYIKAQEWDHRPRIADVFIRHAKVDRSPYAEAVSRKWFISAVARAFEPGCKVDHVLVVEGEQRTGKSTMLRALVEDESWFLETGVALGAKDAMQLIRAKWIVELAELDSIKHVELSRIKQFITTQQDSYRAPYARDPIDQPRSCVFGATTNDYQYLHDETGGGRWWPLRSRATQFDQVDVDAIADERDQLWAEAYWRYKDGERWHLTDRKILAAAKREQESRRVRDPWEPLIAKFIANYKGSGVTTLAILTKGLKIEAERISRREEMRVTGVLRALGWTHQRVQKGRSRSWRHFPPP